MRTRHSLTASAVLLGALMAGCGTESPPGPTAPTPTSPPDLAAFSLPDSCSDLLPASRIAELAEQGLVLLGGPEGRYGDDYLAEPSPEQRLGGITCIWGFDDSEISSVTISAAALDPSTRADVATDLVVSQGLNETAVDDSVVYWQQGDTDHEPALVNVLRDDSWISVIQTFGGVPSFDEAREIAAEVHEATYR